VTGRAVPQATHVDHSIAAAPPKYTMTESAYILSVCFPGAFGSAEHNALELVGIHQEHEFMHLFAVPPCAHPGCALPINGQEPGLSPPHTAIAAECAAIEYRCATTTFRIPNGLITNDSRLRRTSAAR
jgi:hypothetical protein